MTRKATTLTATLDLFDDDIANQVLKAVVKMFREDGRNAREQETKYAKTDYPEPNPVGDRLIAAAKEIEALRKHYYTVHHP